MSRRKAEWQDCTECGQPEYRRRKYGVPFLCYECVALRIAAAAQEMADKQGPAWEAWLASNARGAPGASQTEEG